jgi:hypothetical protein
LQEPVVDRTHASADLEHGLPIDTPRGERLDQCASQAHRAVPTVGAQMPGRVANVELTIERGVAG